LVPLEEQTTSTDEFFSIRRNTKQMSQHSLSELQTVPSTLVQGLKFVSEIEEFTNVAFLISINNTFFESAEKYIG